MTDKEPVLLVLLIDTNHLSWHIAGIRLDGRPIPLIRSEAGSLNPYLGQPLDEQLDFLRHRLSGVLQIGCDRLWGRMLKPCQIVFLADSLFPQAESELTQCVAEHFVQWMANPPVVFLVCEGPLSGHASASLRNLAGEIQSAYHDALVRSLPELWSAVAQPERWEIAAKKPDQ